MKYGHGVKKCEGGMCRRKNLEFPSSTHKRTTKDSERLISVDMCCNMRVLCRAGCVISAYEVVRLFPNNEGDKRNHCDKTNMKPWFQ
jgi:hypothetical protein